MRNFALLFAALSIIAPAQAQGPAPAEPIPAVSVPTFADAPAGTPATAAWKKVEAEGPVALLLQPALAAKDALATWLVEQKVCAADAKVCFFGLRFRMTQEDPDKAGTTTVVQYAIQGATESLVQGYSTSKTLDMATHRYWFHDGKVWKLRTAPPDRKAEYERVGSLIGVVEYLVGRGQLTIVK